VSNLNSGEEVKAKLGFKNSFVTYISDVYKMPFLTSEEEKELGKQIKKIRDEEVKPYISYIRKICKNRLAKREFDTEIKSNVKHVLKLLPVTIAKSRIALQQKKLILFLYPNMVWKKDKPIWSKSSIQFRDNWDKFIKGKQKLKNACKPLVEANLRLVINICKKYVSSLNELELIDLIQEGNIGLMRSALTWDCSKSKFSTYAFHWVRQGIIRVLSVQNDQQITFPVHMNTTIQSVLTRERKLEQELGRKPNNKELANRCKVSLKRLKEIKDYVFLKRATVYLNTPTGEMGSEEIQDLIEDKNTVNPSDKALKGERKEKLESVMSLRLTAKEFSVIKARFLDDKKLREVGAERNLTRERIRQIELKALNKLRHPSQLEKLKDFSETA